MKGVLYHILECLHKNGIGFLGMVFTMGAVSLLLFNVFHELSFYDKGFNLFVTIFVITICDLIILATFVQMAVGRYLESLANDRYVTELHESSYATSLKFTAFKERQKRDEQKAASALMGSIDQTAQLCLEIRHQNFEDPDKKKDDKTDGKDTDDKKKASKKKAGGHRNWAGSLRRALSVEVLAGTAETRIPVDPRLAMSIFCKRMDEPLEAKVLIRIIHRLRMIPRDGEHREYFDAWRKEAARRLISQVCEDAAGTKDWTARGILEDANINETVLHDEEIRDAAREAWNKIRKTKPEADLEKDLVAPIAFALAHVGIEDEAPRMKDVFRELPSEDEYTSRLIHDACASTGIRKTEISERWMELIHRRRGITIRRLARRQWDEAREVKWRVEVDYDGERILNLPGMRALYELCFYDRKHEKPEEIVDRFSELR